MSYLGMHNIVLQERNHLTTNAMQLRIHYSKSLQYIWPVQPYVLLANVSADNCG